MPLDSATINGILMHPSPLDVARTEYVTRMPIDSYSPCPGGLDKKVKFCCPDLVGELDKIHRMIEGDQRLACLDHIEKLEGKYAGRACLLVTKLLLQEQLERLEDAEKTVTQLLASQPENPIALAVQAVQSAEQDGAVAGIEPLQRAMLHCPQQMPYEVFDAVGQLGRLLAAESHLLAAIGHLRHYALLASGDRTALSMLYQLNSSPRVPLIFKDWMYVSQCPPGAMWQPDFDLAVQFAQMGAWRQAEQRLTVLANRVDDSPVIWRNLAVWRGWLADNARAAEAMRKYASLPISLDDAVEAETIAQIIDPVSPYAEIELISVERPILDFDRLKERLLGDPAVLSLPVDNRRASADDRPPPQAMFVLCDKPLPKPDEPLSAATMPDDLAQIFLFGRETDREPRLEMIAYRDEQLASTQARLTEIGGDALEPPGPEEVLGGISGLLRILRHVGRIPPGTPPEIARAALQEYFTQIVPREWLELRMPLFDGQTPRQVAGKPEYLIRLLGAVSMLELSTESTSLDIGRIRNELGLPEPDPIPAEGVDVSQLPLVRLHRLPIEQLSDQQLVVVFRRAQTNAAIRPLRRAAEALVARESAPAEAKIPAHEALASGAADLDESIGHLRAAGELAVAAGKSSADWDIAELELRMVQGNAAEIQRLLNHVRTEHIREPGVRERLMQVFVAAGVITPDGRMVQRAEPQPASSIVLPSGEPAAEPGKLWTPGSEQPATKSALWTPGMD